MSGANIPEVGEPAILCDHRCILPDGHDGPHQHGYYLPAVSRASDRAHVAERERKLLEELERAVQRVRSLTMSTDGDPHAPHRCKRIDALEAEIDRLREAR